MCMWGSTCYTDMTNFGVRSCRTIISSTAARCIVRTRIPTAMQTRRMPSTACLATKLLKPYTKMHLSTKTFMNIHFEASKETSSQRYYVLAPDTMQMTVLYLSLSCISAFADYSAQSHCQRLSQR